MLLLGKIFYLSAMLLLVSFVALFSKSASCLCVYLSVHLSVCLSIRLSSFLSVRLSVCPSVHLSVCPSVRLSVYPFTIFIMWWLYYFQTPFSSNWSPWQLMSVYLVKFGIFTLLSFWKRKRKTETKQKQREEKSW